MKRTEKEAKIASGEYIDPLAHHKRVPKPPPDPNAPKKPRGRPKKNTEEETPQAEDVETANDSDVIPYELAPIVRSLPVFIPEEASIPQEEPLPQVKRRIGKLEE